METVYLSFGNNHVQNKNISKYSWKDRSFDFLYHMKMESVVFFNCRFLLLHLFRYVFVLHVVWWLYLNKKAKCLLILVILLNVLLLETVLAKCLPPKSWCVVSFVCEMISRSQWTFCFLIINHRMNCWYFSVIYIIKTFTSLAVLRPFKPHVCCSLQGHNFPRPNFPWYIVIQQY